MKHSLIALSVLSTALGTPLLPVKPHLPPQSFFCSSVERILRGTGDEAEAIRYCSDKLNIQPSIFSIRRSTSQLFTETATSTIYSGGDENAGSTTITSTSTVTSSIKGCVTPDGDGQQAKRAEALSEDMNSALQRLQNAKIEPGDKIPRIFKSLGKNAGSLICGCFRSTQTFTTTASISTTQTVTTTVPNAAATITSTATTTEYAIETVIPSSDYAQVMAISIESSAQNQGTFLSFQDVTPVDDIYSPQFVDTLAEASKFLVFPAGPLVAFDDSGSMSLVAVTNAAAPDGVISEGVSWIPVSTYQSEQGTYTWIRCCMGDDGILTCSAHEDGTRSVLDICSDPANLFIGTELFCSADQTMLRAVAPPQDNLPSSTTEIPDTTPTETETLSSSISITQTSSVSLVSVTPTPGIIPPAAQCQSGSFVLRLYESALNQFSFVSYASYGSQDYTGDFDFVDEEIDATKFRILDGHLTYRNDADVVLMAFIRNDDGTMIFATQAYIDQLNALTASPTYSAAPLNCCRDSNANLGCTNEASGQILNFALDEDRPPIRRRAVLAGRRGTLLLTIAEPANPVVVHSLRQPPQDTSCPGQDASGPWGINVLDLDISANGAFMSFEYAKDGADPMGDFRLVDNGNLATPFFITSGGLLALRDTKHSDDLFATFNVTTGYTFFVSEAVQPDFSTSALCCSLDENGNLACSIPASDEEPGFFDIDYFRSAEDSQFYGELLIGAAPPATGSAATLSLVIYPGPPEAAAPPGAVATNPPQFSTVSINTPTPSSRSSSSRSTSRRSTTARTSSQAVLPTRTTSHGVSPPTSTSPPPANAPQCPIRQYTGSGPWALQIFDDTLGSNSGAYMRFQYAPGIDPTGDFQFNSSLVWASRFWITTEGWLALRGPSWTEDLYLESNPAGFSDFGSSAVLATRPTWTRLCCSFNANGDLTCSNVQTGATTFSLDILSDFCDGVRCGELYVTTAAGSAGGTRLHLVDLKPIDGTPTSSSVPGPSSTLAQSSNEPIPTSSATPAQSSSSLPIGVETSIESTASIQTSAASTPAPPSSESIVPIQDSTFTQSSIIPSPTAGGSGPWIVQIADSNLGLDGGVAYMSFQYALGSSPDPAGDFQLVSDPTAATEFFLSPEGWLVLRNRVYPDGLYLTSIRGSTYADFASPAGAQARNQLRGETRDRVICSVDVSGALTCTDVQDGGGNLFDIDPIGVCNDDGIRCGELHVGTSVALADVSNGLATLRLIAPGGQVQTSTSPIVPGPTSSEAISSSSSMTESPSSTSIAVPDMSSTSTSPLAVPSSTTSLAIASSTSVLDMLSTSLSSDTGSSSSSSVDSSTQAGIISTSTGLSSASPSPTSQSGPFYMQVLEPDTQRLSYLSYAYAPTRDTLGEPQFVPSADAASQFYISSNNELIVRTANNPEGLTAITYANDNYVLFARAAFIAGQPSGTLSPPLSCSRSSTGDLTCSDKGDANLSVFDICDNTVGGRDLFIKASATCATVAPSFRLLVAGATPDTTISQSSVATQSTETPTSSVAVADSTTSMMETLSVPGFTSSESSMISSTSIETSSDIATSTDITSSVVSSSSVSSASPSDTNAPACPAQDASGPYAIRVLDPNLDAVSGNYISFLYDATSQRDPTGDFQLVDIVSTATTFFITAEGWLALRDPRESFAGDRYFVSIHGDTYADFASSAGALSRFTNRGQTSDRVCCSIDATNSNLLLCNDVLDGGGSVFDIAYPLSEFCAGAACGELAIGTAAQFPNSEVSLRMVPSADTSTSTLSSSQPATSSEVATTSETSETSTSSELVVSSDITTTIQSSSEVSTTSETSSPSATSSSSSGPVPQCTPQAETGPFAVQVRDESLSNDPLFISFVYAQSNAGLLGDFQLIPDETAATRFYITDNGRLAMRDPRNVLIADRFLTREPASSYTYFDAAASGDRVCCSLDSDNNLICADEQQGTVGIYDILSVANSCDSAAPNVPCGELYLGTEAQLNNDIGNTARATLQLVPWVAPPSLTTSSSVESITSSEVSVSSDASTSSDIPTTSSSEVSITSESSTSGDTSATTVTDVTSTDSIATTTEISTTSTVSTTDTSTTSSTASSTPSDQCDLTAPLLPAEAGPWNIQVAVSDLGREGTFIGFANSFAAQQGEITYPVSSEFAAQFVIDPGRRFIFRTDAGDQYAYSNGDNLIHFSATAPSSPIICCKAANGDLACLDTKPSGGNILNSCPYPNPSVNGGLYITADGPGCRASGPSILRLLFPGSGTTNPSSSSISSDVTTSAVVSTSTDVQTSTDVSTSTDAVVSTDATTSSEVSTSSASSTATSTGTPSCPSQPPSGPYAIQVVDSDLPQSLNYVSFVYAASNTRNDVGDFQFVSDSSAASQFFINADGSLAYRADPDGTSGILDRYLVRTSSDTTGFVYFDLRRDIGDRVCCSPDNNGLTCSLASDASVNIFDTVSVGDNCAEDPQARVPCGELQLRATGSLSSSSTATLQLVPLTSASTTSTSSSSSSVDTTTSSEAITSTSSIATTSSESSVSSDTPTSTSSATTVELVTSTETSTSTSVATTSSAAVSPPVGQCDATVPPSAELGPLVLQIRSAGSGNVGSYISYTNPAGGGFRYATDSATAIPLFINTNGRLIVRDDSATGDKLSYLDEDGLLRFSATTQTNTVTCCQAANGDMTCRSSLGATVFNSCPDGAGSTTGGLYLTSTSQPCGGSGLTVLRLSTYVNSGVATTSTTSSAAATSTTSSAATTSTTSSSVPATCPTQTPSGPYAIKITDSDLGANNQKYISFAYDAREAGGTPVAITGDFRFVTDITTSTQVFITADGSLVLRDPRTYSQDLYLYSEPNGAYSDFRTTTGAAGQNRACCRVDETGNLLCADIQDGNGNLFDISYPIPCGDQSCGELALGTASQVSGNLASLAVVPWTGPSTSTTLATSTSASPTTSSAGYYNTPTCAAQTASGPYNIQVFDDSLSANSDNGKYLSFSFATGQGTNPLGDFGLLASRTSATRFFITSDGLLVLRDTVAYPTDLYFTSIRNDIYADWTDDAGAQRRFTARTERRDRLCCSVDSSNNLACTDVLDGGGTVFEIAVNVSTGCPGSDGNRCHEVQIGTVAQLTGEYGANGPRATLKMIRVT